MEWPQSWPNFTKGCFVPNLVEIGSEVLEKKNWNFVIVYVDHFAFAPLREGCGPLIELTWNPFTKSCFVQGLVEIGKDDFQSSMYFIISLLSPLMKGATYEGLKLTQWFLRRRWKCEN